MNGNCFYWISIEVNNDAFFYNACFYLLLYLLRFNLFSKKYEYLFYFVKHFLTFSKILEKCLRILFVLLNCHKIDVCFWNLDKMFSFEDEMCNICGSFTKTPKRILIHTVYTEKIGYAVLFFLFMLHYFPRTEVNIQIDYKYVHLEPYVAQRE